MTAPDPKYVAAMRRCWDGRDGAEVVSVTAAAAEAQRLVAEAVAEAVRALEAETQRLTKELEIATRMIQRNAATIAVQLHADLDALKSEEPTR